MKKLILTAAALVAFAGMSQAATIYWGSTVANIYNAAGTDPILPGEGVVQLVMVSGTYDGVTGHYETETVFDQGLVGDGVGLPKKGKYVDTYTYIYGDPIVGGDTFVIRVYDAATVGAALNVWNSDAFSITATDNAGGDTLLLSSPTTTSGDWSPVPEPATAGLLAMGLAAVALRRKFRK